MVPVTTNQIIIIFPLLLVYSLLTTINHYQPSSKVPLLIIISHYIPLKTPWNIPVTSQVPVTTSFYIFLPAVTLRDPPWQLPVAAQQRHIAGAPSS